ncbi:uncharacterized protein SCODWIG_01077 [Saccharomycodes ludwigii]|uniref:Sm protein B n=1 Tax=Saccharomycodes ludwigii TaxID=36035 RepID=A0A376B3Q4_9ASCO|nr:uncharacterized protein SCODWIG_01077 [Saccharomycodes ludwigii]
MTTFSTTRLSDLIDYRIKVLTTNGAIYIGKLMGFDKHMNLCLLDCIEKKITNKQLKDLKKRGGTTSAISTTSRTLGFIILRGEHILTTTVEEEDNKNILATKKQRITESVKLDKKYTKKKNKDNKRKHKSQGKIIKAPIKINNNGAREKNKQQQLKSGAVRYIRNTEI